MSDWLALACLAAVSWVLASFELTGRHLKLSGDRAVAMETLRLLRLKVMFRGVIAIIALAAAAIIHGVGAL